MTTTKLNDTDAPGIAGALLEGRRAAGSPAMGMVMTLVIVCQEEDAEDSLRMAQEAAREHPSRLLAVVMGNARGKPEINAEIRAGSGTYGEMALIRLSGEVAKHADSVVLPLLLPDSPVVVWWPTCAPSDPAADPIGRLGTRRITDAAEVRTSRTRAMLIQCEAYAPGNTDLAWTRITGWRALLAASLDQLHGKVTAVDVTSERISPSAELLGGWLAARLKAPVTRHRSDGPGITEVRLATRAGDVRILREDGRSAVLSVPGQPDRPVALRRRPIPELLSEELRRLDPDEIYEETVRWLSQHNLRKRSASRKSAQQNGQGKRRGKTASSSTRRAAKKSRA
jgi:glucose-6-phosphate dehydrogenase assembly protein OpcA